jgi:hypothetical protein
MTDTEREKTIGLCCIIGVFACLIGLVVGFGVGTTVGNREVRREAHKAGVGRWESDANGAAEFKYGKFEEKK